jgi:hypothetical protein
MSWRISISKRSTSYVGHLAVLGDRPSVYIGAQRPRDQVLFDSLIDAAPPLSLTWPKDIRPKFRASFGFITVAFSAFPPCDHRAVCGP